MFRTSLKAEDLPTGKRKLLTNLVFDYNGTRYVVKKGFVTDGTSMPWFLGWWVSPWKAPFARSAVLHDLLYKEGEVPREFADTLFCYAIKRDMVYYIKAKTEAGKWKGWQLRLRSGLIYVYCYTTAELMFLGLRLAGWVAWNKHRRNDL